MPRFSQDEPQRGQHYGHRSAAKLTVRPAIAADLKAIMGIYNWAVNQTFATLDNEPLDQEEAADWWEAHGSKSLLLVAECEVPARAIKPATAVTPAIT